MNSLKEAQKFHAKLHKNDPHAWATMGKLQTMAAKGNSNAKQAMNLLKNVHAHHNATQHADDGSPRFGGYPFPKFCSAGVCVAPSRKMKAGAETTLPAYIVTQLKSLIEHAITSVPKYDVTTSYSTPGGGYNPASPPITVPGSGLRFTPTTTPQLVLTRPTNPVATVVKRPLNVNALLDPAALSVFLPHANS